MSSTRFRGALRGIALRDQIGAVLRDNAPIPMRPSDIAAQLGTFILSGPTCGHDDCFDPKHQHVYGERSYQNSDLAPHLRAFERAGNVQRLVPDARPGRSHYYRWVGSEPEAKP